jgi:hypothetical protein
MAWLPLKKKKKNKGLRFGKEKSSCPTEEARRIVDNLYLDTFRRIYGDLEALSRLNLLVSPS